MFSGFSKDTIKYFEDVSSNNNKLYFRQHKTDYLDYVKAPLKLLHTDLSEILYMIDPELCINPARCISSEYTDARFSKSKPIKEYLYLRYRLLRSRKDNIPGLFFDSSRDGLRYGLKIYNSTSKGMSYFRDALLNNLKESQILFKNIHSITNITVEGKDFAKDHFPAVDLPLKDWLNKKDIMFCYSSEITDSFFSRVLSDEIEETFLSLSGMYQFLKKALDNCRNHKIHGISAE